MGVTRRVFLRVGGAGLVVSACAPASLRALDDVATPAPLASAGTDPLLVVVFLRGGADGLHLVPPVGDPGYEKLRPSLALSQALPFTRDFGLHPKLAALHSLVERGELAVVHAVGSQHPTRSHFEAQDFMELGEPGALHLSDGWLARGLDPVADESAFASLALTSQLPLSLRGSGSFAIADPSEFGLPDAGGRSRTELARRYASGGNDPLAVAGASALEALAEYERRTGARRGARRRPRRPNVSLKASAGHVVALERAGLPIRAVFLESSGWDTHLNQGTESGAMARAIDDLAGAVAHLSDEMAGRRDLLVVVMTEFGRTVRANGSRGSDHGHGSVMFVAGPRVRGGVYGDWPGLSEDRLYQGRDLPVTTDYRSVLWEVLRAHLGSAPPADTFPGFEPETLGML